MKFTPSDRKLAIQLRKKLIKALRGTKMEKNKCEKCGAEMISYKKGHTAGMVCPKCEWNWTYTHFEPFEIDETIYNVKLEKRNNISMNEIKVISNIINENYSKTSIYMKNGDASFKGKSNNIVKKLIELNDIKINYSITLKFPYDLKEIEEYLKSN